MTYTPRKRQDIERILQNLRALREGAVAAIKPLYSEIPILRQSAYADLPGLRLLVLSNILLDAFNRELPPAKALNLLRDPKHLSPKMVELDPVQAASEMNRLFQDELLSFRRSLNRFEEQQANDQTNPFDFILYDPIRSRLRDLAETLSAYAWGSLIEQYATTSRPAPSQETSCESALTKRTL